MISGQFFPYCTVRVYVWENGPFISHAFTVMRCLPLAMGMDVSIDRAELPEVDFTTPSTYTWIALTPWKLVTFAWIATGLATVPLVGEQTLIVRSTPGNEQRFITLMCAV